MLVPRVTVLCTNVFWLAFQSNYACVVACDNRLNVTHATVNDLNCVPIENFVYLWPTGKCVSTNLREWRAMFVLTFLLNGGLIPASFCCDRCGMYSSLWLKLLCPSAF